MFDFHSILEYDEEILYESKSYPGKGDKDVTLCYVMIPFFTFIIALLALSLKYKIGDGAYGLSLDFIVIFGVAGIADLLLISDLIYKKFIKDYATSDDLCCITNKRILKYETRKEKLTSVYIHEFDTFSVAYTKGGYGDAIFFKKYDGKVTMGEIGRRALNVLKKEPDIISFEGIKNPRKAVGIAKQQYNKLTS